MTLVDRKDPDAFEVVLRPPRRRRLLARPPDRRRPRARRGRHAGGVPLDLAQQRPLRPARGQRSRVGARHRPQPGDRRAAARRAAGAEARPRRRGRARDPARPASAPRPRRSGARPPGRLRRALGLAAARAVAGDRARLLRRLQPLGDRRDAGRAARHRQGPDAARAREDQGDPRRGDPRRRTSRERTCERTRIPATASRDELQRRARRLRARRPRRAASRPSSGVTSTAARSAGEHLRWLQPAVDLLPRAVPRAAEPPPRLRKRLMATVRGEVARGRRRRVARRRARWRRSWARLVWRRPATAVAAGALLVARWAGAATCSHEPTEQSRHEVRGRAHEDRRPRASGTLERDGRLGDPPRAGDAGAGAQRGLRGLGAARRHDGASSLFALRRDRSGDAAIPGPLERRERRAGHRRAARRQPAADDESGAPAEPPLRPRGARLPWGPGEAQVDSAAMATCYRHPDRETNVSCSNCGRPICPDCMTATPVGMRCPECARERTQVRRHLAGLRAGRGAGDLRADRDQRRRLRRRARPACAAAARSRGGGTRGRRDGGALSAPPSPNGDWWRIVTAGFLHAGLIHLAFNMFVLFILGTLLEPAIGTARFLGVYFVSLLAGSFGALLLSPNAFTVGASGAIFGLMSAAFMIARHRGHRPARRPDRLLHRHQPRLHLRRRHISVGGHLGGLIGGALAGLLIVVRGAPRPSSGGARGAGNARARRSLSVVGGDRSSRQPRIRRRRAGRRDELAPAQARRGAVDAVRVEQVAEQLDAVDQARARAARTRRGVDGESRPRSECLEPLAAAPAPAPPPRRRTGRRASPPTTSGRGRRQLVPARGAGVAPRPRRATSCRRRRRSSPAPSGRRRRAGRATRAPATRGRGAPVRPRRARRSSRA